MRVRATKRDAAGELAEQLVQTLEAQRALGPEAYALPLGRLVALADPQADPALAAKAVGKKTFTERVVIAQKKNPAAPVALREDLDQLADSWLLLQFVLEATCTPEKPTCPVAKLKSKLDARLKGPFEAAVRRRIAENTLPPTVRLLAVKKTPHLHLVRLPLPKEPEIVLAERLIAALHDQRRLGPGHYPPSLKQLVEQAGLAVRPALLKKALASQAFQQQVVIAVKNQPQAPVALAEDRGRLAGSDALLTCLLRLLRTATSQAFSVAVLKKKLLLDLCPPFEEAVDAAMRTSSLPPGVGWIAVNRNRLLCFVEDVHTTPSEPRPSGSAVLGTQHSPTPDDFAVRFDTAFARLDRQQGGHNFVHLRALRQALPDAPDAFDGGLRTLRRAGRYTLSAAEGRHGVTPEERAAGITEDGTLLLYVSRRSS